MLAKPAHQFVIWVFLISVLTTLSNTQAFAQKSVTEMLSTKMNANDTGILAKGARELIGVNVYVCDIVKDYKLKKKQITRVDLGSEASLQNLVIIFNETININKKGLLGSKICVSGKVVKYRGRPTIIVSDQHQLATQILL